MQKLKEQLHLKTVFSSQKAVNVMLPNFLGLQPSQIK